MKRFKTLLKKVIRFTPIALLYLLSSSGDLRAQDTIIANYEFLLPFNPNLTTFRGAFREQDYRIMLIDSLVVKNYKGFILSGVARSLKPFQKYFDINTHITNLPYPLELSGLIGETSATSQNIDSDDYWDYSGFGFNIPGVFNFKNSRADDLFIFDGINISGVSSRMEITNINSRGILISNLSAETLRIDSTSGGLMVYGSSVKDIDLSEIHASNPNGYKKITLSSCKVESIWVQAEQFLPIRLIKDSILKEIGFRHLNNAGFIQIPELTIKDCYFDAKIHSTVISNFNKVVFDNVQFGANADLSGLLCDTIVFNNCGTLPRTLAIDFMTNDRTIYLSIVNTDFQDARFTFHEKIRLLFNDYYHLALMDSMQDDMANSTYQMLLDKFKKEGRTKSLELVDIDYAKWKASNGSLFEKVFSFISMIWWYYGYKRWLILLWTFIFILFFFIVNSNKWHNVRSTYPIIPEDYSKRHKDEYALIYTLLVFFSLRIDFDKIDYKKRKYVYWFLFQYFIGITCLFFILNAIIKI